MLCQLVDLHHLMKLCQGRLLMVLDLSRMVLYASVMEILYLVSTS